MISLHAVSRDPSDPISIKSTAGGKQVLHQYYIAASDWQSIRVAINGKDVKALAVRASAVDGFVDLLSISDGQIRLDNGKPVTTRVYGDVDISIGRALSGCTSCSRSAAARRAWWKPSIAKDGAAPASVWSTKT